MISRPECLRWVQRDERGCGKRFWKRKSVRFGFRFLVSSGSFEIVEVEGERDSYRMERELSMYLDRRGRVEIVAFQKYDLPVYKNNDELKKLREIALRHLSE